MNDKSTGGAPVQPVADAAPMSPFRLYCPNCIDGTLVEQGDLYVCIGREHKNVIPCGHSRPVPRE
jgi:hypothetical protein